MKYFPHKLSTQNPEYHLIVISARRIPRYACNQYPLQLTCGISFDLRQDETMTETLVHVQLLQYNDIRGGGGHALIYNPTKCCWGNYSDAGILEALQTVIQLYKINGVIINLYRQIIFCTNSNCFDVRLSYLIILSSPKIHLQKSHAKNQEQIKSQQYGRSNS